MLCSKAGMALGTRSYARGYLGSGGLPPGIRWLLIINVAVFLIYFFFQDLRAPLDSLGLRPSDVVTRLFVWQLFTYMFLHLGIGHILWNMLALWMFGREFEETWGTRRFLRFYFYCGIGAGICVIIANYLVGTPQVVTVGSSGAIYGLLMAAAVLWPDRQMLFYFLIPLKMKWFVMIVGALAFLNSFNSNSSVSNVAHLGGMLVAYLLLKLPGGMRAGRSSGPGIIASMQQRYDAWKIQRAKKKFQVYMRKQGSARESGERKDRDRWVN